MLNTPKLPHGHTGEISCAPLDAHQGNTEQADTIGLPLPPGNTLLDPLGPVGGAQATQISQPTISVLEKGKIKRHSSSNPIPVHKALRLIFSDDAQVTTEPQL